MNERRGGRLGGEAAIAAAQARRDRARLAAAQAEILRLKAALAQAEPVGVKAALKRSLRARLGRLARPRPGPAPAAPAAAAVARGRALIIDDHWPQPDRDSGSVDICNMAEALMALGFDVVLAAAKALHGEQPARAALQARGIPCLMPADGETMETFIARQGGGFDLCVLCRVFCGGQYLEAVLAHCIKARIVFNSIDLNFLREARQAELLGDDRLRKIAEEIRPREEHVIRSCDATIVVSAAEQALLAATLPDCLAVTLPLARPLRGAQAPFVARRGIGFIGGFAHAPNVDAVRYFLDEIWPLVRAALPDSRFSIVGADAPAELVRAAPAGVEWLGHVPDVGPWFEGLRLTVAPLRFGAGAKGKVASSLAAGVPCVASEIATEGMGLSPAQGVLTAGDPAAFAAAVIRLHGDADLWKELSAGAISHAGSALSLARWRDELDTMLARIGI